MNSLAFDLRDAFRTLAKHRLLSVSAISTMALAIAANTAIFALVYGVLLKPLPLPDASRLVRVEEQHRGRRSNLTGATFADLHERSRTLAAVAAYRIFFPGLSDQGAPEQVTAAQVSPDYFAVLAVAPAVGRWFGAGDFVAQAPRTVVVSDGIWQRRFGADPHVVGKRVSIDAVPAEIIGIAPSRPFAPGTPEIWLPASPSSALMHNRRAHLFTVIGRVNPHDSVDLAQREIEGLASGIEHDSGSVDSGLALIATPLQARMVENARPALLMLWAGVSLVMLIAAANIANGLLMHASARVRELSIRMALGAGRSRIVRQLVIESGLLSCAGGSVGTGLGVWSVAAMRRALPGSIPRAADLGIDPLVIVFGVLASLVMAAILGLPFAVRGPVRQPIDALRSRTSGGTAQPRTRSVLVMTEVAFTVVLLAGTGLLGRSLWALGRVEPGFNSTDVLTFRLSLPSAKYADAAAHGAFYETVLDRVGALPGVAAAGATGALPLTGTPATTMEPEGQSTSDQLGADVITVTPGFFSTLQIPLRRGRLFSPSDLRNTGPVALVNETAARRFWPDGNAVGRHITMKNWGAPYRAEVIGIVGDLHQAGIDTDVSPAVYYPLAQFPETTLTQTIVVRATESLQPTISAVKEQVWAVDSNQPIASIRTMDEIMSASIAERRFNLLLLAAFALTAVVLSAVGIYGIVAFAVAERTHEIGVRLALGARTRDLVLLVVAHGAGPVASGLTAGFAGALLASRLLGTLLFGVRPTDALTLTGVVIAIGIVATAACAGPIRRALRVEPIVALRVE